MNTHSNMKAYLEKAFNISKFSDELSNKDSLFYLLCIDEKLSGYLKLNEFNVYDKLKTSQKKMIF